MRSGIMANRIDLGTAAGVLGLVASAAYFVGDRLKNLYFSHDAFSLTMQGSLILITASLAAISITSALSVCGLAFGLISEDGEDIELTKIASGLLRLSAFIFLIFTVGFGLIVPLTFWAQTTGSRLLGERLGELLGLVAMLMVMGFLWWIIPDEALSSTLPEQISRDIGKKRFAVIAVLCYSGGFFYAYTCRTFEANINSTVYTSAEVLELSVIARGAMYVPETGPVTLIQRFEDAGKAAKVGQALRLVDLGTGSYKAWLPLSQFSPGIYVIEVHVGKEPAQDIADRMVERFNLDRFKKIDPLRLVFYVGK